MSIPANERVPTSPGICSSQQHIPAYVVVSRPSSCLSPRSFEFSTPFTSLLSEDGLNRTTPRHHLGKTLQRRPVLWRFCLSRQLCFHVGCKYLRSSPPLCP